MSYFTEGFIQFFSDLEKNNNTEWFHANKKRYETFVKNPMQLLVTDLIAELKKFDPEINVDAKKCIGRINRDIRFSKEKTPYNVKYSAHIYKDSKTDPIPVIAFQLGSAEMAIMSGYYNPSKEKISYIRDQIKSNTATFKKIYSDPVFISKFGTILGESLKRIPVEYKETFDHEPLVAKNQFYFMHTLKSDLLLTDQLLPVLIEHYKAAKPLNDFLT